MIVTVDEVKTHLRIQHDEEDTYIESLIKRSQTAAEDYCRVKFEPVGYRSTRFISATRMRSTSTKPVFFGEW